MKGEYNNMPINFYAGIDIEKFNKTVANYKSTPYYKGEDSYLIMNSDTLKAIQASDFSYLVKHIDNGFTYDCLTIAICEKLNIGEVDFK